MYREQFDCRHLEHEFVAKHCEFPGINIVKCNECGLILAHPMPSSTEIADYYESDFRADKVIIEDHFRMHETYAQSQLDFIMQHHRAILDMDVDALDFGAGSGALSHVMRKNGFRVVGVEPDSKLAAVAASRYGLDIRIGTLDTADMGNRKFDVVCMSHVLEHLPDPLDSLRRIKSLLKTDGVLFIEVPYDTVETILTRATKGQMTGSHLYFYSPLTLEMTVKKAGYTTIALYSCGMPQKAAIRYWHLYYSTWGKLSRLVAGHVRSFRKLAVRTLPRVRRNNPWSRRYYSSDDHDQGISIRALLVPNRS